MIFHKLFKLFQVLAGSLLITIIVIVGIDGGGLLLPLDIGAGAGTGKTLMILFLLNMSKREEKNAPDPRVDRLRTDNSKFKRESE